MRVPLRHCITFFSKFLLEDLFIAIFFSTLGTFFCKGVAFFINHERFQLFFPFWLFIFATFQMLSLYICASLFQTFNFKMRKSVILQIL